jgi:protein-L-isoaspartate(D-aspartate) O-methyltransferase
LNRGTRFCRPLRHHSATWPGQGAPYTSRRTAGQSVQPSPTGRVVRINSGQYKRGVSLHANEPMSDYAAQRINMVESQVRANDVTDSRVVAAMREVPREKFVPGSKRAIAYADAAIEIVPQRYLLDPRSFSKLLQLAEIGPDDVVLDVGCTTGYSTAVIARLARRVTGLEQDATLMRMAYDALPAAGAKNASIVQGALVEGFREKAPYDVIFINGAVEKVPDGLLAQLADGGRLVTVIQSGNPGQAALYLREHGRVGHRVAFNASVPLLAGFRETVGFVF